VASAVQQTFTGANAPNGGFMKKSVSNFLSCAVVCLAFVSTLYTYSVAAEGNPILNKKELKILLHTAKTPAQHRTIAAYYRQQAQALNAKAAEHSAMADQRVNGPRATIESKQGVSFGHGASHCRYFAKQYADQAKEAAILASAHEEEAARAEQR
jgi:hypothetical protein